MNKSEVWDSFKKLEMDKAICNHCNKMLSCKGSSTSNLHNHLKAVHKIIIEKKSETIVEEETPGSSSSSKKQTKILNFMKVKRKSLEEIISKLAAMDGFSINSLTNSSFIRESLQQQGYSLPKNNSRVMDLIHTFYDNAKRETIITLDSIKKNRKKFSITLDEWTSKRNHRYLNINIHHLAEDFNLGLVPIAGSCDAQRTLELVTERLQNFNLNLETDIIAATNDGAAVMKKFGKLSSIINQLCYSHAIQLAVTDVLYEHREIGEAEAEVNVSSEESEDEDENEYNDYEDSVYYACNREQPIPILCDNYKQSVSQIRKICKFFRKSPVRNTILQNYIKQEKGKELNLILDCKTRWNSIEDMIERFLTVKESVVSALNDIGSSYMWNEAQYPKLLELHKVLGPIRLATEGLGRRDANLLTSEGIFGFLLSELKNLNTEISLKLLYALEERIQERRQIELATLLLYLQNPENISSSGKKSSVLSLASKSEIIELAGRILSRIFPDSHVETDSDEEQIEETTHQSQSNTFLREAMEKSIHKFLEDPEEKLTHPKTLKAEFSLFEATNKRTKNLDLLFDALKTIKPTSIASERVFSISGNIVSKIRTRLSHRSVDVLCFLKSYFLRRNEN